MEKIKCAYCGKSILKNKCQIKAHKNLFCNSKCAVLFNKPRTGTGKGVYFNCQVCGKEFYVRPYRAKSTNVSACSKKCLGILNRGSNYEFWQKQSPIIKKLRRSKEYRHWRYKVFKRDDYTCKLCGLKDILKPIIY